MKYTLCLVENYLDKLNEQQRAAVLYCDGPQLVVAGAGTGKTRVITTKIVHLMELGLPPYRIMALTFTNKAAREMRYRVETMAGSDLAQQVWMGTFHSIFGRLLRINSERLGYNHDYTIYDTSDSRAVIKTIVKRLGLELKTYNPASILARISLAKNNFMTPEDYKNSDWPVMDQQSSVPMVCQIYRDYCIACREANAMDFDDLLVNTYLLLNDNADLLEKYQKMFQYFLVDEYQDTNRIQNIIITLLAQGHNRLCLVGDDAQSIYSFRGADVNNILKLKNTFPDLEINKLECNYRSTKNIINAANSLIAKNRGQIGKIVFTNNEQGEKISIVACSDDYDEAYEVARRIAGMKARQGDRYNDYVILYRTNAQSRVLEEALSNGGRRDKHGNARAAIPYRIYGGVSFYQRKEIKDIVAYLRLAVNPHDNASLLRVINVPRRGIGDTTIARVTQCSAEQGVSMWQVICAPDTYGLNVNKGIAGKLSSFVNLINDFVRINHEETDAFTLSQYIIKQSKIVDEFINDTLDPENISRKENVEELLGGIKEFVSSKLEQGIDDNKLVNYLGEISLYTDQDEADTHDDAVTLMTVHAAKGLEFKNVFIVGMEEDLFPSYMSGDSIQGLEEERRLFYVAITRAMKNCVISYAAMRFRNGEARYCVPSRFIDDIDARYVMVTKKADSYKDTYGWRRDDMDDYTAFTPFAKKTAPAKPHIAPPKSKPLPKTERQSQGAPQQGNAGLHTAGEIAHGMAIAHSRFGRGVIEAVDTSGQDDKIVVNFDDGSKRVLMLKFARFQIL